MFALPLFGQRSPEVDLEVSIFDLDIALMDPSGLDRLQLAREFDVAAPLVVKLGLVVGPAPLVDGSVDPALGGLVAGHPTDLAPLALQGLQANLKLALPPQIVWNGSHLIFKNTMYICQEDGLLVAVLVAVLGGDMFGGHFVCSELLIVQF